MLGLAGARPGSGAPGSAAPSARIVIVGAGYAGSTCALALRRLAPGHEVVLIDPSEPYFSCPGSNTALIGLHPVASLRMARAGVRRAGVLYVRDGVDAIEGAERIVRLTGGARLPYDRLVVAPGIRFLWERIEGADADTAQRMPHAWAGQPQLELLAAQLRAMRRGGLAVISVPAGPMRCPPGPYERASLMAYFLKRHNPRAKVLILDARNSIPRQSQFMQAWQQDYPGMIEWVPVTQGGAVERIDPRRLTLYPPAGPVHADLVNLIPPQAPAALAPSSGLAAPHGWCPVQPESFESTLMPGIHVIGDASIAGEMPKSASAAMSEARQCAAAIVALLAGREPPSARFDSVCYAHVAPVRALSIPGRFVIAGGIIAAEVAGQAAPVALDAQGARLDSAAAERWSASARAAAFGE